MTRFYNLYPVFVSHNPYLIWQWWWVSNKDFNPRIIMIVWDFISLGNELHHITTQICNQGSGIHFLTGYSASFLFVQRCFLDPAYYHAPLQC